MRTLESDEAFNSPPSLVNMASDFVMYSGNGVGRQLSGAPLLQLGGS